MAEHTIHHEQGDTKGRWFITLPDGEAEMTYSRAGESTIIIDHTGMPANHRGEGLGEALVEHGVLAAREQGLKIIPLCPFAKAQIMRHAKWQDVLK